MHGAPHATIKFVTLQFGEVLNRNFYNRPVVDVAKDSLGKILVHGETAGRIVEVEAYLGVDDLASHAARGVTPRTRVMFGPPGHAYIYFIYGMYECLNFVCEPEGSSGCLLIRALEPLAGLDIMRLRRPAAKRVEDLACGPGRLTLAMGITRELNGTSLIDGPLQVRKPEKEEQFEIDATPRIGITKCADWPLRFVMRGSLCGRIMKSR